MSTSTKHSISHQVRLRDTRLRAIVLLGHGWQTKIAKALDVNRVFVANILGNRCLAAPTLARIEAYLEKEALAAS